MLFSLSTNITQLQPLCWIIFALQPLLNQAGIITLSSMKNSEQLFQQHYIENGAENSLLTSKPAYEIIKIHRERIRKKKKIIKTE